MGHTAVLSHRWARKIDAVQGCVIGFQRQGVVPVERVVPHVDRACRGRHHFRGAPQHEVRRRPLLLLLLLLLLCWWWESLNFVPREFVLPLLPPRTEANGGLA